jgi:multidrug resistance efflux pump
MSAIGVESNAPESVATVDDRPFTRDGSRGGAVKLPRGTRRPPAAVVAAPARRPDLATSAPRTTTEAPSQSAESGSQPRRHRRLLLLVPILLIVGAVAVTMAYRYWYDSTYFVMTENTQVTGDLVQVGSLNAGRLLTTRVDVGDVVQQGQEIAVVGIPQQIGSVPFSGAPVLDETGNRDAQVAVRAPINGIVAARLGSAGGTVAPGQAIFDIVDPAQVWVRANVEEDKIARIQPGQLVEVHIDALGKTFAGRVEALTPASAATFSLLPAQNTSGNFTKVTQLVPVKISVDSGNVALPLGTSVEVKVQVQPAGGLPWQR